MKNFTKFKIIFLQINSNFILTISTNNNKILKFKHNYQSKQTKKLIILGSRKIYATLFTDKTNTTKNHNLETHLTSRGRVFSTMQTRRRFLASRRIAARKLSRAILDRIPKDGQEVQAAAVAQTEAAIPTSNARAARKACMLRNSRLRSSLRCT